MTVHDEADTLRAAAVNAIVARAGLMQKADQRRAAMQGNPFAGMKLLDMAKASLERAGISCSGLDQRKIVAMAFTQSTSDFPVLLENAMHKVLQTGYAVAAKSYLRAFQRAGLPLRFCLVYTEAPRLFMIPEQLLDRMAALHPARP